jgi:hypothetical protein
MAGKIALQLTDLPPALSIERAAKLLGLSRSSAYRAAANGQREAPGQEGVQAGGFEPPRVAPPGPKLRTWCADRCCPGLYHTFKQGGWRRVVPACACPSQGFAARPVSNPVSMGSVRLVADASSARTSAIAWHWSWRGPMTATAP